MKQNEMRVLLDQAYDTLDHAGGEAAAEHALVVLARAPKESESYLLMAEVAEENLRPEQALMWLDLGLSHHPQHPGLLVKKASILMDEFEEIDEAYEILMGITLGWLDTPKAAINQELGHVLVLEIYLLLTDCLRLKGRYSEAKKFAMLAHEVAPSDENALLAVATAHFELGDYDQALHIIEPIEKKDEPCDFFRLKAKILCAKGQFAEADTHFLDSYRLNRGRYHRPQRLSQELFLQAFDQAILALPREIRSLIETCAVEISDVVPPERIKQSLGTLSPEACIIIDAINQKNDHELRIITLFQKNIENLALKKEDIKDIIASALLHELGKVVRAF